MTRFRPALSLFYLLLLAYLTGPNAAPLGAQIAPDHHWVGFADKVGCGVDLLDAGAGPNLLSQRALDRRARQGIALDSLDLPVPPHRIADVLALGQTDGGPALRLLHRSKWFNGIVVQIDTALVDSAGAADLLAQIAALDGVVETRACAWYTTADARDLPVLASPRSMQDHQSGAEGYGMAWGQTQQLRLDLLHGLGHRGAGLMVGVLDSGFDRVDTNPAFARAHAEGRITVGGNFPNGGAATPWIYQEHAHGAMVLSTMVGHLDTPNEEPYLGTAPDAAYVVFRTEDVDWEHLVEEYHWVAAAERADSMGCDVLNTSLGYSLFDDEAASHDPSELDGNTFRITQASDIAATRGMLVFSSAGNSGNSPWQKITAPADGDSVIAVGAVDVFGQHASFSGYGPTADGRIKPDLSATGRDAAYIHPDGTIRTGNGTSFSSPVLCGAATSLWSAHPDQPAWAIRRALIESASQMAAPDTVRGFGIPDLWAAHLALGGQAPEAGAGGTGLLVYPNPVPAASGTLHLVFEEANLLAVPNSPLRWTVCNALGQTLAEGSVERGKESLSTLTLDVGPLATGTHLLRLDGVPEEDATSRPTAWARFVVE